MSKKWMYNGGFILVCVGVLFVLYRAPEVKTPRTPNDASHATPKVYEGCPTCHIAGGDGPIAPGDHLNDTGEVLADRVKCYFCHKPPLQ